MFKQHLDMIGLNESPNKKAKFWQSYVRSLKGSDDIRAHDKPDAYYNRRPYSVFEEPDTASARITSHGYRYLPVHRETYGYSPRGIYAHQYKTTDTYRPSGSSSFKIAEAERAFKEHLERMKEIDRRYPSRYGLYLKDKPHTLLPQDLEYEPESKPYH